MVVAYVLGGVLAVMLLYLAWVYYVLFCKEKKRDENLTQKSFYSQNQEFAFAYPSRQQSGLPLAGKVAAVAGLFVASRRHKTDKGHRSDVNKDRTVTDDPMNKVETAIDAIDLINSDRETNIDVHLENENTTGGDKIDEGKSVRFENNDGGGSSDKGISYEMGAGFGNSKSDEGYGTNTFGANTGHSYGSDRGFGGSSDNYGYESRSTDYDQGYSGYDNTNSGGDGY